MLSPGFSEKGTPGSPSDDITISPTASDDERSERSELVEGVWQEIGATQSAKEPEMPDLTTRLTSPLAAVRFIMDKYGLAERARSAHIPIEDLEQEGLLAVAIADRKISELQHEGSWQSDRKGETGYLFASIRFALADYLSAEQRHGAVRHKPPESEETKERDYLESLSEQTRRSVEQEAIDSALMSEVLRVASSVLTERQRQVLYSLLEDKNYDEIGQSLGLSLDSVGRTASEVVTKFRKYFGIDPTRSVELFRTVADSEKAQDELVQRARTAGRSRREQYFAEWYAKNREYVRARMRDYQRQKRAAEKSSQQRSEQPR